MTRETTIVIFKLVERVNDKNNNKRVEYCKRGGKKFRRQVH